MLAAADVAMRGTDRQTGSMFSYVSSEALVPLDHPLRPIRVLANRALERLSGEFDKLHAVDGRDSIAAEKLLRGEVAGKFFAAVLAEPEVKPLLSSEHFSVDGTLIETWASMKSFRPKDGSGTPPGPGRNGERDFHGEKRSNETHASTTDPDARLARKSEGQASKLCYAGHVVMENRHGLVVAATTTRATGTAERDAGEAMMAGLSRAGRSTLGTDKNHDTRGFVAAMRRLHVTPHVAQHSNGRRSAIDRRTIRHTGYAVSQCIRKRIEEVFGWGKEIGGMRRTLLRGLERVGWSFTLRVAAYNPIRLPKLLAATA